MDREERWKDVKPHAWERVGVGAVDERVASERTVAPPRQEAAEERRQGVQRVLRVSGVRERKGEALRRRGWNGDGTRKRRRKEVVVLVSTG